MDELNHSMKSLSVTTSSLDDTKISTDSDKSFQCSNDEKSQLISVTAPKVPQSLAELNFSNVCEASDRLNISECGTALFTNAVFEMVGYITSEYKGLVVTPSYIRKNLATNRSNKWDDSLQARLKNVDNIKCFSFDGKKNTNARMEPNPHGLMGKKRGTVLMENIVVVKQPEMELLGFISTPNGS